MGATSTCSADRKVCARRKSTVVGMLVGALVLVAVPVSSMAQEAAPPVDEPVMEAAPDDELPELGKPPRKMRPPPEPPPVGPWGLSWRAALGSVAAAGAVQGLAVAAMLGLGAVTTVATMPQLLKGDTGVCIGFVCLLTPVQGFILMLGAVASSVVAPLTAWLITRGWGRSTVRSAPVVAAWTIPLAATCALAGVLQYVGNFGNCCCTWCGTLCFASFLVDRYDWDNDTAEYYALRRVAPPLFHGCYLGTQLGAVAALIAGPIAAALLTGLWVGFDAEPLEAEPEPDAPEPL